MPGHSPLAEPLGGKPRTADYAMQVLSRVLSHAVDPLGRIAGNPCEGIKQLYNNDRSEIIWTDPDIAQLKKVGGSRKIEGKLTELPCLPEIAHAIDLAAHTGLRLGDLLRLSWSHMGEDAITLATGKSRGRREAIIPLYDGLRDVLARIPKRATTVLTSSKPRPWTANGFRSSFNFARPRQVWPTMICTFTTCAAQPRPSSISPAFNPRDRGNSGMGRGSS